MPKFFHFARAAACLLFVVCLVGCSEVESLELPKSSLEGKITYKGKEVPHALVIVTSAQMSAQGHADENGVYKVEYCPTGSVKIGVNTAAGRGKMMGEVMSAQMQGRPAPKFVDIPEKYFDPSSSGIETTLSNTTGPNTFDIELK